MRPFAEKFIIWNNLVLNSLSIQGLYSGVEAIANHLLSRELIMNDF